MFDTDNVFAVIVTYNPSVPLLRENIAALVCQVSRLIILDNGSKNVVAICCLLKNFPTVEFYEADENLGLARQYNQALYMAYTGGYKWLLTMDQDTVVPKNLVDTYLGYGNDESVGIISPVIWNACVYRRHEVEKSFSGYGECTEVTRCISSAAMHRVSALREAGTFDEALFIDYVDDDCCRSIRAMGYRILRINNLLVRHYWGKSTCRKVGLVNIVCPNYPAIRYYYIFRNRIYFERKYGGSLIKLLAFMLYKGSLLLLESQRRKKYCMAARGVCDGFKRRMGKCED